MPFFSVNFYYRQFDRGWTEQYYLNGSTGDISTTLATLVTIAAPQAAAFRHQTTILQGIRVRDVASTRASAIQIVNANGPVVAGSTHTPDAVKTSMRVIINSSQGYKRSLFLRGLDDALTVRDKITGQTNPAAFIAPVSLFLELMKGLGAVTRFIAPVGTASVPAGLYNWQNVISFGPGVTNPQWTVVNVPAGSTLPGVNNFVYFRGLPRPTFDYLAGRLRVMAQPTGTSFEVNATWRTGAAALTVPDTQWRWLDYGYSGWTSSSFAELTSHSTGGPTNRPRGRRSAAFRRRLPLAVQ